MTKLNTTNEIKIRDSEEISLKEILIQIKNWIGYLKKKWLIIIAFSSVGAVIGLLYAYSKKPVYLATLTFVVEEEKNSAGGGLTGALGLASTFGIDLGGSSGGGIFSGANLIELMKSRSLVEKTLLNPITVDHKQQSLASYYIGFRQLNKGWDEKPDLKSIKFEPFADRSRFTLQQDSILGKLYEEITGPNGALAVAQKDKKVGIITIDVHSNDELFSKVFAECLAKVVSDFYIETKTKKAKYNYDILQKQTDSIRNELNDAISNVAIANDNTYNLNPALNVKRATSSKRQVDVQANTAILTQLVANLEMSKVSLRKETPLIEIIDKPILPLKKDRQSKSISLLLGGLFAGLIVIVVLILRRTLQNILK